MDITAGTKVPAGAGYDDGLDIVDMLLRFERCLVIQHKSRK